MNTAKPSGRCQCGCGREAKPGNRFVHGHHMRKHSIAQPGDRFGYLTITEVPSDTRQVPVRCVCGTEYTVYMPHLRAGLMSCGCMNPAVTKHGHARESRPKTPTYLSWRAMLARCKPEHVAYRYYGGRGITVCDRWTGENGFENFLADMGERRADLSLDRIDPDGNYEPGNCRWADARTQRLNRSRQSQRSRIKEAP